MAQVSFRSIAVALLCLSLLWSALPAQAAASTPLVVGIFPRRDAAITTTLFTPLADYLAQHLKRPVTLATAKDFPEYWKNVEAGRYDLIHCNQYQYLQARRLGYTVVAANEELGKAKIRGAIIVRKDSGIDSLAELRGRKIVFGGDRTAMMSYIVPRYLLQQAGLRPGDYREEFAPNPPNAVFAAYFGSAAAAGAGAVVLHLPLVTGHIDTSQLKILAQSAPLPHLPWAVKRTLPTALRERIATLLTGLGDSAEGRKVLQAARLTGLHAVTDADYAAHQRIIDAVFGPHALEKP